MNSSISQFFFDTVRLLWEFESISGHYRIALNLIIIKSKSLNIKHLLLILSILLLTSCNKDSDPTPPDAAGTEFGKVTSAVVIVNPVINLGSTTSIIPGSQRDAVEITAGDLDIVSTDNTGLAVIKELPTGIVPFSFSSGAIDLNVIQEKELYDIVVSYTPDGVQEIISAVRYPIGGEVVRVSPGDDLAAAVASDNAIVFLDSGVYETSIVVNATGVLIFGSWDEKEGSEVTIKGTLKVNGGNVRMRGITVDGLTTVNANGFSAAFCEFNNANISGNSISLLRNIFNGTEVSVPSSNAVLVDNENIP